jgi:hypothetical protein
MVAAACVCVCVGVCVCVCVCVFVWVCGGGGDRTYLTSTGWLGSPSTKRVAPCLM